MLITGGTDGLGKILAEKFCDRYRVIVTSRTQKWSLSKTMRYESIVLDVCDENSVQNGIRDVLDQYKTIDCLINNAGIWIEGPLEKNSGQAIRKTIETNLTGTVLVTQAVVPIMKTQKKGLIININSQNGLEAKKERSIYIASKWGVTGFTKSIQDELSEYNIRVTGIYPGKMRTNFFEKSGVQKHMHDAIDPIHVVNAINLVLSLPDDVIIPEIGIRSSHH